MQPDDTLVPIVQARWSRGCDRATIPDTSRGHRADFAARLPCAAAESGRRTSISGGGVHAGHSFFAEICLTPDQVKPGRPTPDAVAHRLAVFLHQEQNLLGVSTMIVPALSLPR